MKNKISSEVAWELFEYTGNIESYLLYSEYKREEYNEYYTDKGVGSEDLQYE